MIKRSKGVTIFAIIFLVIAVARLLSTILMPLSIAEVQVNYYHFHRGLINRLSELKQKADEISDRERLDEYRETINRLENNLANFQQNFLIQESITPLAWFSLFFLFFCAGLYILSGITTARLYPLGRQLIFTTVSLGFIANLYIFFLVDHMFESIKIILKDVFWLASNGSYAQVPAQTIGYFSIPDFIKITAIVYLCIQFIFVLVVFYFFTRPKVKEQFKIRE